MSYKRISYLQNVFYSKQNLKLSLSNKNSIKTRRSMFPTIDASQEEKRADKNGGFLGLNLLHVWPPFSFLHSFRILELINKLGTN